MSLATETLAARFNKLVDKVDLLASIPESAYYAFDDIYVAWADAEYMDHSVGENLAHWQNEYLKAEQIVDQYEAGGLVEQDYTYTDADADADVVELDPVYFYSDWPMWWRVMGITAVGLLAYKLMRRV